MDTTLLGVIIGGCLANIHHIIDCIKWICKSAYLYISKKINKSKQQKEQKYYSEKIINLIQNKKELEFIIQYLEQWKQGCHSVNIQSIEDEAPNFFNFLLEFYSESLSYSNYENSKKGSVSLNERVVNNLYYIFKTSQIKLELNNKEPS